MLLDRVKLEFIGSFLLFYLTGMASINYQIEAIDIKSFALILFLTYTLTLWFAKPMSQAHFNPSLTIVQTLTKHTKLTNLPFYLFAQFLAAIFAGSLIKLSLSGEVTSKIVGSTMLGIPLIGKNILQELFLETIASFFLVLGYYLLIEEKDTKKYIYAPALGGIFAAVSLFLYPETGAGLNFAKVLAFGLLSNQWKGVWEYLVASLLGALIGGFVGNLLLSEKAEISKKRKKKEKDRRKTTVLQDGIEKNLLRDQDDD